MNWNKVTFWLWMAVGPVIMTGHIYKIQYILTWIVLMSVMWERLDRDR